MKPVKIKTWRTSFSAFMQPRSLAMLFLGISAGIPLLLIFSSLSLWLREAGVERADVTFFSWAALAYSFKFVWAPIVGAVPIPRLSRAMGQRRSWLLLSQLAIITSIIFMASVNPAAGSTSLIYMALAAVCLGFSSATQDIVIDAYRIEAAPPDFQALMSSVYIAGYRIGMIISGAGALYLADILGSGVGHYKYLAWKVTYLSISLAVGIGVITTLLIAEPKKTSPSLANDAGWRSNKAYVQFFLFFIVAIAGFILVYWFSANSANTLKDSLYAVLRNSTLAGVCVGLIRFLCAVFAAILIYKLFEYFHWVDTRLVKKSYLDPVSDFFKRFSKKQVILILLLISLYRISDIVMGVVANLFYQDLGFTKTQIAEVVKLFGLVMILFGGFIGGAMSIRYGVMKTLTLGAVLCALTNLLFVLMAKVGPDIHLFYLVISADNLAGGLAMAAFVAYLSSLVNLSFTASQYAIFSSIMTLFPKILAGYSGTLVDLFGYASFFLFSAVLGVPVLFVIYLLNKENVR